MIPKLGLFRDVAGRTSRAVPPVVLGTLFNVLDAVSTGVLVFPSDTNGTTFRDVQVQGMSMYIASTLICQMVMTLGGSRFPGALGAMLIEVLPFLRNVATDVRQVLGDDSPSLVPTVMAAYALTSLLIGICFVMLGILRAGNLTVLTGAIGGIGVSLFTLGLGLCIPPAQGSLTLHNARALLFSPQHAPLLVASCAPAMIISVSTRWTLVSRITKGFPDSAYFVPFVLGLVPTIFWITVAGLGLATHAGMDSLASSGWLFQLRQGSATNLKSLENDWNYWALFDFHRVAWHAIGNAAVNLVLVVVIGVLNLPVYVPALGLALQEPVHMNHELIGQGLANILGGCIGTAPNILQLSYSVFFTRAKGGRVEAGVVILVTAAFFVAAPIVLPFVPTVLASALVLFLGIELSLEALWEGAKTMLPTEYFVAIVTLVACTFAGFAEGFGIGLGTALGVYLLWRSVDAGRKTQPFWPSRFRAAVIGCQHDTPTTDAEKNAVVAAGQEADAEPGLRVTHVRLNGYVFFGKSPKLEKVLLSDSDAHDELIIVDLTAVHRVETSVLQTISRSATRTGKTLIFCGMEPRSSVHLDFLRSGVDIRWPTLGVGPSQDEASLACFGTPQAAREWFEAARQTGAGGDSAAENVHEERWQLGSTILEVRSYGAGQEATPGGEPGQRSPVVVRGALRLQELEHLQARPSRLAVRGLVSSWGMHDSGLVLVQDVGLLGRGCTVDHDGGTGDAAHQRLRAGPSGCTIAIVDVSKTAA